MAKKKNVVKVETRKDEVRYVTSDMKKKKFLLKAQSIDQSTIIPISQYIPKEFSLAYATEE